MKHFNLILVTILFICVAGLILGPYSQKAQAYQTDDTTIKDISSIIGKSESIVVDLLGSTILTEDDLCVVGLTTREPDKVRLLIVSEGIAGLRDVTVIDDEFEEELDSTDWDWYSSEGATKTPSSYIPGTYELYAIHPMSDGAFDMDADKETNMKRLAAKGYDAFMTILGMNTIDDEVSSGKSIGIQYPSLALDPVDDVKNGEDLEITGATNRADGIFFILNVDGPGIDETVTAKVTNGVISATFDTSDWQPGSYRVTAEDIDDICSDEADFNVLQNEMNVFYEIKVTPSVIEMGESADITVSVENRGTIKGMVLVSLQIDGKEVESISLLVEEGATESFIHTYDAEEEGTFIIEANGDTETLTVTIPKPSPTPTTTPPPTPTPSPTIEATPVQESSNPPGESINITEIDDRDEESEAFLPNIMRIIGTTFDDLFERLSLWR